MDNWGEVGEIFFPKISNNLIIMLPTWPRQAAFIRHENRLRLILSPLRTVNITDWDSGLSVTLQGPGQMPLYLPSLNIQLIRPEYPKPVAQPISEFARHIPSEIQELAGPYRWKQFSLLQLCSRSQQVVELMQSLPMLAWLLANATDASNAGVKESCALATQQRVRILASLVGREPNPTSACCRNAFLTNTISLN